MPGRQVEHVFRKKSIRKKTFLIFASNLNKRQSLLALFRSHYAFNHFFLLVYIAGIRFKGFIFPENKVDLNGTWVYQSITSIFSSPVSSNIVSIIVLWLQSILINNIVNNHKLSKENTLFPGLMYVIFISILPGTLYLNPVIITYLLVISGLFNVVEAGKQIDIRSHVFNAGLFFALSAFISSENLYFIIFGIVGFYSLKTLKLKQNLQYTIGVLSAFIFLFSLQYLLNQPPDFQVIFSWTHLTNLTNALPTPVVVTLICYLIILIFVFIQYPNITEKKNIQTRKKIELFYLFMFFLLVSFLSLKMDNTSDLLYLALPFGTLTGIWMADQKTILMSEFIHFFALGSLLISHYLLP